RGARRSIISSARAACSGLYFIMGVRAKALASGRTFCQKKAQVANDSFKGRTIPRVSVYGPRYRGAVTLKDATHLACAVLQSKQAIVELAKRRFREETSG